MEKVRVAYSHDSRDFAPIYLAVLPRGRQPATDDWVDAFRDMEGAKRVVWARFDNPGANDLVWVRDRAGVRQAVRMP